MWLEVLKPATVCSPLQIAQMVLDPAAWPLLRGMQDPSIGEGVQQVGAYLEHGSTLESCSLQHGRSVLQRFASMCFCSMKLLAGGPHGACSVALLQAHTGGLPLQLDWRSESGGEAGGAAA